jgi:hypothetical protein
MWSCTVWLPCWNEVEKETAVAQTSPGSATRAVLLLSSLRVGLERAASS